MTDLIEPLLGRHPERVHISNSEIQTYKRCKRRWWLAYYRGLQPVEKTALGPLDLGTRVHNALEAYYANDTNPVDEYNRLLRIDNRLFLKTKEAQYEANIDEFNSLGELGRIMIEGYLKWAEENNVDAAIEVVGAEQILTYRLEEFDPRVELIGKVDLKVRRAFDGAVAIFDHKTAAASKFGDYGKYVNFSEQLMMYVMLERLNQKKGDPRADGGTYNILKKVKRTAKANPPFFERIDVRFNNKSLQSFYTRILGTVRDIMNTRDALDKSLDDNRYEDHKFIAYPNQQMDWSCGTCPFFKVCGMLDDGSSAEAMISDQYVRTDPNARYDEEEGNDK